MTDDEFIASFEDGSLPTSLFTTRTISKWPSCICAVTRLEALQRFSTSLARFAAANGRPEIYNETITWAFVLLIRERIARTGHQQTFTQFAAVNPDLLSWKDNVLKTYYRDETLSSDLARRTFLFPDKTDLGGKLL